MCVCLYLHDYILQLCTFGRRKHEGPDTMTRFGRPHASFKSLAAPFLFKMSCWHSVVRLVLPFTPFMTQSSYGNHLGHI